MNHEERQDTRTRKSFLLLVLSADNPSVLQWNENGFSNNKAGEQVASRHSFYFYFVLMPHGHLLS